MTDRELAALGRSELAIPDFLRREERRAANKLRGAWRRRCAWVLGATIKLVERERDYRDATC